MRNKKHNPAEAAVIQELRKTMTLDAIAASKGVNVSVIQKILNEHGETRGGDQAYKPRVLAPWPPTANFANDNVFVRD